MTDTYSVPKDVVDKVYREIINDNYFVMRNIKISGRSDGAAYDGENNILVDEIEVANGQTILVLKAVNNSVNLNGEKEWPANAGDERHPISAVPYLLALLRSEIVGEQFQRRSVVGFRG